ncbi:MAG TPA: dockerin type I domain-containing protein [Phycisphaerae bacterium]|nr:dockerin type I domain-containing protein [Phycisphaerae bacterium]
MLDSLESRVLFSTVAVTWTGGDLAHSANWSDALNWEDVNHNHVAPISDATHFYEVTFNTNASLVLDQNVDISSLNVVGNAAVTIDAINTTLNVKPSDLPNDKQAENVYLTLANGATAKLTLVCNGTSQNRGTINAKNFYVAGDAGGHGILSVQYATIVNLTGNLDTQSHQTDIEDFGSISAANAYMLGVTTPTTGDPRISNLTFTNGTFAVGNSGVMRVGGVGRVNLTATTSTITTGELNVDTTSMMDVSGGTVTAQGRVNIGASNDQTPTMVEGPGAQLKLHDGAVFTANRATAGIFVLNSGQDAILSVTSGAHFSVWRLNILSGDSGSTQYPPQGPVATFSGSGTVINVTEDANIGSGLTVNGVYVPAGKVVENDSAEVHVGGLTDVWSGNQDAYPELSVSDATWETQSANFGWEDGGPGWYARVWITNGSALFKVDDGTSTFHVGQGLPVTLVVDGGTLNSAASIVKAVKADISGTGTIISPAHPAPGVIAKSPHADFVPGDALVRGLDGALGVDIASSDPFGTLTIDSDLDASLGMTLDAYLGSDPGESSQLAVTGTATIAGTFAAFADPDDALSYQVGDSFVVLTAGHIVGTFGDLPEGEVIRNPDLPVLGNGLAWYAHYTDTQLTLTVGFLVPLWSDTSTSGITGSPDRIDIGGAYVQIGGPYGTFYDISDYSTEEGWPTSEGDRQDNFGWFPLWQTTSPDEDRRDDGQFGVQLISAPIGNKLAVAIISPELDEGGDGWTFDKRVVVFFGEATLSPGASSITVTSGLSASDLDTLLNNSDFSSLVSAYYEDSGQPFVVAAYGGTVSMNFTSYPPTLTPSFQVNDGSAQRSMVNSLTVTFNHPVYASADTFELTPDVVGVLGGPSMTVTNPSGDLETYVLTFSWALPDGSYELTVDPKYLGWGQGDPSYILTGSYTFNFTALFGDSNGDGVVDSTDLAAFVPAFGSTSSSPAYVPYFDVNGDGVIDDVDMAAFSQSYGPIAPTVTSLALLQPRIAVGSSDEITGMLADPVLTQSHDVNIDWGDGTDPTVVHLDAGVITFTVDHVYAAAGANGSTYVIEVSPGGGGGVATAAVTVVQPSLGVIDWQINDGSAQRSMITSLTVVFNQSVTLGDGAITLDRDPMDGSDLVPMPIAVSNPSGDGKTYVITFTDSMYEGGSLPDGIYYLTVHGGNVTSNLTGRTGIHDQEMDFYRLFGDVSGDGGVDDSDLNLVIGAWGTSGPTGDVNGDGTVDGIDLTDVYDTWGDHV